MKTQAFKIATALFALGMLPLSAQALTTSTTMTVSTVLATATASISTPPTPLNFGTVNLTGATYPLVVTATSSIGVTVTSGAPYSIEMDLGLNSGWATQPNTRAMRGLHGTQTSNFDYFMKNTTTGPAWGTAANAVTSVGTGAEQIFAILGEYTLTGLYLATSYSDTVTLTVVY